MTASATRLESDRVRGVSISHPSSSLSFSKTTSTDSAEPRKHRVQLRKRKESQHPLRDLRVKAGLTLEGLSEATKMSPSYLSRLESGSRRLNEDIISRLSQALNCTPAELLMNLPSASKSSHLQLVAHNNNLKADLPLFTISENSNNESVISSISKESINRPSDFHGIRDAFGCKLENSFWAPRYRQGDTLLLNPQAPLKDGCSIMVRTKSKEVFIGTYNAVTSAGLPTELKLKTDYSEKVEDKIFALKDIDAFRIVGTIEG